MNVIAEYNVAMSYQEYVDHLENYRTLHELHYNKFKIPEENIPQITQLGELNILVITEPWCSDSLALLPIIRKLAELNGRWEIKVLFRDKNPDFMEKFLTNGVRSIPIFLFLNLKGDIIFNWGPRPKAANLIYETYRDQIKSGSIEKQTVIKKIRTYYAKDRGNSTFNELLYLFNNYLV